MTTRGMLPGEYTVRGRVGRVENEMKGWMGLTPLPNYIITRELAKNTSFDSAERRLWRAAEP